MADENVTQLPLRSSDPTNGLVYAGYPSDGTPDQAVKINAPYGIAGLDSTGAFTTTKTITVLQAGGNGIAFAPNDAASAPSITTVGTDANINLDINTKGTGVIALNSSTQITGTLTSTDTITSNKAVGGLDTGTNVPIPGSSGAFLAGANNIEQVILQDMGATAGNRRGVVEFHSGYVGLGFMNDQTGGRVFALTAFGGAASGITSVTSNSGSGTWNHTGSFTINNHTITQVVATDGKVNQAADVNAPTFYAVPTSGLYRVSAFIVISQAATTSSTLPGVSVSYTEAVSGAAVQDIVFGPGGSGNTVGLHLGGSIVVQAQQGANIGYITTGYASSGATPMQFAVTVKVEALQ